MDVVALPLENGKSKIDLTASETAAVSIPGDSSQNTNDRPTRRHCPARVRSFSIS